MKRLNQLIKFLHLLDVQNDVKSFLAEKNGQILLADLQIDSRQLKTNDVFIALQGLNNHGLDYLSQAVSAKVACIVSDRTLTKNEQACLDLHNVQTQPVVTIVRDLPERLAELADWFYDQPSKKLKVVGITGTNGKTSTAHYLAQMLVQLGQTPALIGTLGSGLVADLGKVELSVTLNTTPDVVSVFRLLNEFYQQSANWVVMEVSSHALELGRVEHIEFEAVALTQVTRDHLDFHGTERAYQQAKKKLFTNYKSKYQVINISDPVGRELIKSEQLKSPFLYSLKKQVQAQLTCEEYSLNSRGIDLNLAYWPLSSQTIQNEQACLNLMGAFSIENVLCAMSVLLASGFKWHSVLSLVSKLKAVDGRMQRVSRAAKSAAIIVDFAHTPDALQQVLSALKQHAQTETASGKKSEANLWVVFGCGGDRDSGKRPLMAQVAEQTASKVVLTSDNPRFEAPEKIITDILAGFELPDKVVVIEDRRHAIEFAIAQAKADDVVLIAGKGHENYQDVAGVKQPFSDQQVVLEWMANQAVTQL